MSEEKLEYLKLSCNSRNVPLCKLKEVAELLVWSWDKAQSDTFYSWVLKMNKSYQKAKFKIIIAKISANSK